jgi:L-lactate dehydrogenase complex protein LldE
MRPTPDAPTRPRVQLFPTCLVNDFLPQAGIAAVGVLERAGFVVEVPAGLTCCGQPAYNAGFRRDAKAVARRTYEILAETEGTIVIPSGSCADMLIHQGGELFRDEPAFLATVQAVAGRCRELTQFLVECFGFDAAKVAAAPRGPRRSARVKVAYHPSCHLLRGLGVADAPVDLLAALPDVELVALPAHDECCGFGGMFSVKQPEISGAMLDRKCRALEKSGADVVASCDAGCLLHLIGGMRRRGLSIQGCHVAELLDSPAEDSP